jgi:Protein of unknown function (DUF2442)
VDANSNHHRRDQDRNLHRRSSAAALSCESGNDAGQIRHCDGKAAKRQFGQEVDAQGTTMDGIQWRFVDAGLDQLAPEKDDDEIVTVGGPIWDVVKVEAIAPLTLAVEFEDGLKGRVRFETSYLRGHFAKLADPAYFAQVSAPYGAVSWPNEQPDMAPDTMYDEIKAHGEWVLQ